MKSVVQVQAPLPITLALKKDGKDNTNSFVIRFNQPTEKEKLLEVTLIPYTYLHTMAMSSSSETPYQVLQEEVKNTKHVQPVTLSVSNHAIHTYI